MQNVLRRGVHQIVCRGNPDSGEPKQMLLKKIYNIVKNSILLQVPRHASFESTYYALIVRIKDEVSITENGRNDAAKS